MISNDQLTIIGAIFLGVTLLGFYLAYLYGHHRKSFKWDEYIAIIFFPVVFVFVLASYIGSKIIALFVISAMVGETFEYIAALAYHKTIHRQLWEYKVMSIHGYTSLLNIPMWGICGVMFWFLSKMVGL